MTERTQKKLTLEAHPIFAHLLRRLLPRFSAVIPGNERQQYSAEAYEICRPFKRQEDLFAQGRTTPGSIVTYARGWDSWHTVTPVGLGVASDCVPFNHETGCFEWLDPKDPSNEAMWLAWANLGKAAGLECGAFWKRKDRPHFNLDLAPYKPSDFYREFKDQPAAFVSQAITRLWRLNHPEVFESVAQELEAIKTTPHIA